MKRRMVNIGLNIANFLAFIPTFLLMAIGVDSISAHGTERFFVLFVSSSFYLLVLFITAAVAINHYYPKKA